MRRAGRARFSGKRRCLEGESPTTEDRVRAAVSIKASLLALALMASCKTYKLDPGAPGRVADAASYEAPPARQVVGDALIGGSWGEAGGTGGTGGAAPPATDGAAPAVDASKVDALVATTPDAPAEVDAPAGAGVCTACDVFAPNCPASQNCYPAGAGRTCCQVPVRDAGGGGFCMASHECGAGQVCGGTGDPAGGTCRPLCRPSVATSCLGTPCRPLG